MKIGLLTQEYHTGANRYGGVGRAFAKIAHWMVEHGHEVTVYVQDRQPSEVVEKQGLRVVGVPPASRVHWRLRPWLGRLPASVRGWVWHRESNAALTERILADYRDGRIEVLLTNRGVTAPELMIRRMMPTVVRLQYSRPFTLKLDRSPIYMLDWLLHREERRAIKAATRIYSPSHFVSDHIRKETGRAAPVIPTPMFVLQKAGSWADIKARYKLPDEFMLFWGSFLYCKGVHILADALPQILKEAPGLDAVLIGTRKQMKDPNDGLEPYVLSRTAGFPGRVHLLPPLDQPELFAIIQHARVAVLPSVLDNLPNTLLEAMYFKRVIVATRGASLDEMVEDGKEGFLVESGNSAELARTVVKAASLDEESQERLGDAAARKVKSVCDPDAVINRVVEICGEAINAFQENALSHPVGR